MKPVSLFVIVFMLVSIFSFSQNVGIGTTNPVNGRLEVINSAGRGIKVNSQDGIFSESVFNGVYGTAQGLGFAGRFSNLGNGVALATDMGSVKLNATSGNTGIGISATLGDNPILGKLVVRGKVGAVAAMFGDNTTGIAIENDYPGVGFNSYYNGGRKSIATGFGALVGIDPVTGRFYIQTTAASVSGQGTAMNTIDRINIKPDGNIGIEGNTDPQVALSFATVTGKKISLYRGTTGDAGFGVYGNELRMNSDYNGADITFGYDNLTNGFTERMRIKGNGDVGIGTNAPTAKLDILTSQSDEGLRVGTTSQKFVVRPELLGTTVGTTTGNPLNLMANNSINLSINTVGNVGVGTILPEYKLDVQGRMRVAHTAGNTAGIWFNKSTNDEASFIGQFDDNNFGIYGAGNWKFLFDVTDNTMRIGTTQKASGYLLNVAGKIIAEEVRVQLRSAWPDYVFNKNYKLRSLSEVEKYIATNNHLPNVPAAADVEKSGIALGEMQTRMMEKIEELTLYIIQQERRMKKLEKENAIIRRQLANNKN